LNTSVWFNMVKHHEKHPKSSEMLSAIYTLNPDAISLTTVSDGKIIDCNQVYLNQIGYSREEVIGRTSLELNLFSLEERNAYVNEIRRNKNLYDYEVKVMRKDGTFVNILYSARFITVKGENVILSIGKDITERKKVENELKERENKFRTFFENILDAVLLTIPDGTIIAANPAAEELFGYTEEEICKLGRKGLVYRNDPNLPILVKERVLTGKAKGELNFIKKDGTKFPGEVSTSVFEDSNGNKRTSMVIRDITKRKHADEALLKSEERYRSIIENIQDAYIRADKAGNIIMASPSAAHMYRFDSPHEMIGLSASSLYKNPDDRKYLMEQLINQRKVEDFESEALRRDSSSFLVSLNSQYHYDDRGQIKGTEAFVRDVTERKNAKQQIEYQANLLSQVNDAIIGFNSNLRITYWNKGVEQMYGYTEEEAVDKTTTEILRPIYKPGEQEKMIKEIMDHGLHRASPILNIKLEPK
jgi:PAS domain S-box-containing protein